ncbi:MAG: GNAT family N-acetyltransferase, partial [Pseudomonadota bacterium]
RSGLDYYPKLVSAIPYTPATGPRLLIHPDRDAGALRQALIQQAIEFTGRQGLSTTHFLFTDSEDTRAFKEMGLCLRMGCQYHWRNDGYRDFDDFLDGFSSKKRKNVKRERRRVQEQGLDVRILHGDEVDDALWAVFHRFYLATFERKFGIPTLTLDFFRETARTLGRQVVMVLAEEDGQPVAAALCYRGKDTLYGRYWGCEQDHDGLHFEACYYQGIDYCIRHGLDQFEPGAQGEHKISRGFLPTRTWSAHWVDNPGLRGPVMEFCRREEAAMREQCEKLMSLSPFRQI